MSMFSMYEVFAVLIGLAMFRAHEMLVVKHRDSNWFVVPFFLNIFVVLWPWFVGSWTGLADFRTAHWGPTLFDLPWWGHLLCFFVLHFVLVYFLNKWAQALEHHQNDEVRRLRGTPNSPDPIVQQMNAAAHVSRQQLPGPSVITSAPRPVAAPVPQANTASPATATKQPANKRFRHIMED